MIPFTSRIQATMLGSFLLALIASQLQINPSSASAQESTGEEPLWEIGFAGGGGYVSDYPAAAQNHWHGIALPYLTYRGKYLRAGDEKGVVRGRYKPTRKVEFDLSLSGSFPTDSDDNDARKGMEDLDYLAEVGPRLQITCIEFGDQSKIDLELPIRAIFSTDLSDTHYRGVIFQPEIAFQKDDLLETDIKMKLSAGPIFASGKFMEYIYGVEPQYITPTRPAFSAHGGYLGSKIKLVFLKEFSRRLKLITLFSLGYYGNAENEESPLHQDDLNIAVGFGFKYAFWQSERHASNHLFEGRR